jgi:hypothetical protein
LGRFSRSASHTVSFVGLPLNSTVGVPTLSNRSSRQRTFAVSSMSGGVAASDDDGEAEAEGEGDGEGEAEGRADGRGDGDTDGEGDGGTG